MSATDYFLALSVVFLGLIWQKLSRILELLRNVRDEEQEANYELKNKQYEKINEEI